MLLLTSVNDRLQIITSAAATIDVHASWVDTSAGTITPGRTNTTITTAATTSVAGAPAASTQRNVKTLHVRNVHASLSCDVTIQHTDGTVTSQLYKATLDPGAALEYTDQGGFGGGRMPAPTSGAPTRQVFTSGSGTYTTPAGATYIEVELVAAGGGGGAAGAGTAGGNTTFGSITCNGGAAGSNVSVAPITGIGGTASGGDINIKGGDGSASSGLAIAGTVAGTGGNGGNSFFGGAGASQYNNVGLAASPNSGSGGGGGGATSAATLAGGAGGGAGGYARKLISAPAATYSYAVGGHGSGMTASGQNYAGGNGADGIIIVTEYYR